MSCADDIPRLPDTDLACSGDLPMGGFSQQRTRSMSSIPTRVQRPPSSDRRRRRRTIRFVFRHLRPRVRGTPVPLSDRFATPVPIGCLTVGAGPTRFAAPAAGPIARPRPGLEWAPERDTWSFEADRRRRIATAWRSRDADPAARQIKKRPEAKQHNRPSGHGCCTETPPCRRPPKASLPRCSFPSSRAAASAAAGLRSPR